MKKIFKRISIFILVTTLIATCAFSLFACNRKKGLPDVDYRLDNDYNALTLTLDVPSEISNSLSVKIYYPENVNARYGFLFFVGTFISAEYYDYLGNALAKQGYIAAIPNVLVNATYAYYTQETKVASERIQELYPNVKFFVGGHSQGGGAAMRFACEKLDNVAGAIFMSPLCYPAHECAIEEYNAYGTAHPEWFTQENSGDYLRFDTLANTTLPVLLLEADRDHVLNDEQKNDARVRMPASMMHYVLSPASHMSFSGMDGDAYEKSLNNDGEGMTQEEKEAQKRQTVNYILDFLQITVANL